MARFLQPTKIILVTAFVLLLAVSLVGYFLIRQQNLEREVSKKPLGYALPLSLDVLLESSSVWNGESEVDLSSLSEQVSELETIEGKYCFRANLPKGLYAQKVPPTSATGLKRQVAVIPTGSAYYAPAFPRITVSFIPFPYFLSADADANKFLLEKFLKEETVSYITRQDYEQSVAKVKLKPSVQTALVASWVEVPQEFLTDYKGNAVNELVHNFVLIQLEDSNVFAGMLLSDRAENAESSESWFKNFLKTLEFGCGA